MIELWMSIIGISMALGGIPQILRIKKYKVSKDISIGFWIIIIHGLLWWLYYGISINSISLIITNSVAIIIDLITIGFIIKYRKNR